MERTGQAECAENRQVFFKTVRQTLRMKLDSQQKRQRISDVRFQLQTLDDPVPADRARFQGRGDSCNRLICLKTSAISSNSRKSRWPPSGVTFTVLRKRGSKPFA